MKQNLLKTWLMLVCLVVGVGTSWAEEVTFSLGTSGKDVSSSSGATKSNITVSFANGSGTALSWQTDHVRFYHNGSKVTISSTSANITNIVINAKSGYTSANLKVGSSSLTSNSEKTQYTYTPASAIQTVTISNDGTAQARLTSIVVTTSSSGGGDPTPEPTKYTVSVANNIDNGTVTASTTSAAEGATVTLTATPSTGYEFGSWNVTNASTSAAITVTNNQFTMPAADVNVSATFTVKAARPANEIFYESFDTNDGTGGNDNQWSGPIAANDIDQDNEGWVYTSAKGASHCAKFGTGSGLGSATTPALGQACNATLTFKAAAWNGSSESTTLKLSVIGGGEISPTTVTLTKGAWDTYNVTLTNLTASSKIKFEGNSTSNSRFFLDEVSIVKTSDVAPIKNLSSIAVKTAPLKVAYTEGEMFAPAGLVITKTYDDASTEDLVYTGNESAFTFSPSLTTALQTSDASVQITVGGKSTTQAITVNAIPSHTAHFSVNGTINNGDDSTVKEGQAIVFPADPADINGKKFQGWTKTASYSNATTAPSDLCKSATMENADVTYYAVFATQTGGTKEYSFSIVPSDFNGNSYASNDGSHSVTATATDASGATMTVNYTTANVMLKSSNIQFKSSGSYLYNTTNLGNIVGITNSSTNIATYYGTNQNPSSGSLSSGKGYFSVRGSGGTGASTGITVTFEIDETTYSDYCTTVSAPTPANTINFVATDGTSYYATFSSNRAIKFDEAFINEDETCAAEIKAYAVAVVDGELYLTDQYEVNNDGNYTYIPANTGILFKYTLSDGTFDGNVPFEYADAEAEYLNAVTDNDLYPASKDKATLADHKFYKLAYASSSLDNLGFYWGAADGAAFDSREGSAYLAVPTLSGAAVRGFAFNGGEATAITEVKSEELRVKNLNYYNLNGQRVNGNVKGIVIVNGKKVLK